MQTRIMVDWFKQLASYAVATVPSRRYWRSRR